MPWSGPWAEVHCCAWRSVTTPNPKPIISSIPRVAGLQLWRPSRVNGSLRPKACRLEAWRKNGPIFSVCMRRISGRSPRSLPTCCVKPKPITPPIGWMTLCASQWSATPAVGATWRQSCAPGRKKGEMSKIDETLKKMAAGISKTTTPNTPNTDPGPPSRDLPGDPNCPHCGGVGFLRFEGALGHPNFGKLEICTCRRTHGSQEIHPRLFSMSNLQELRHLTFDSFQSRGHIGLPPRQADSLEQALTHAQHFARTLNGWLMLQGGYGCGKTHLAAAIANFAVELGVPTLFITVPDMLDSLRFAYGDEEVDFEERFDEIRQAQLLILDDFGTQNATPWAQEKLFQIINYRYINRLPLVLTTNLAIGDVEGRIRSRLQDPELVTRVMILAPDYRNPTDDTNEDDLSAFPKLRNCTFSSFESRRKEGLLAEQAQSLEKAFKFARDFAEQPRGWLILIGPPRCGKTHLAAAIANHQRELGLPYKFSVVPDFLDYLRAAFSPESSVSVDRRFQEGRRVPL